MASPVWRIGDFGRFRNENRRYPRFEVIGSDKVKGKVAVWFSGWDHPISIPRDTFMEDCDNFWDVEVLDQKTIPDWVVADNTVAFQVPSRTLYVTITEIKETWAERLMVQYPDRRPRPHTIDVNNRKFHMRRRHGDYVSCMSLDTPKQLLLIPIKLIAEHGELYKEPLTVWDMIGNRDLLDPDEIDFT